MNSDITLSPKSSTSSMGLGRQEKEEGLEAYHLHLGPFFFYSQISNQALPKYTEHVIEQRAQPLPHLSHDREKSSSMQPRHPTRATGQGKGKKTTSVTCQWSSTEIKIELHDTQPSQNLGLIEVQALPTQQNQ